MAILFEFSEDILKQAALIAAKYPDRTILSIVEECFMYGARSLYSDAPRPVPPERKPVEDMFNKPIPQEDIDRINSIASSISIKAQEDMESIVYDDDEVGDALSDLSEAIYNEDGSIEF